MAIGSLIAIYFVLWWLCLFAVLPWGVKTQAEDGEVVPGTFASAPVKPNLLKKAVATSILAAVILGVAILLIRSGVVSLDTLPGMRGPDLQ